MLTTLVLPLRISTSTRTSSGFVVHYTGSADYNEFQWFAVELVLLAFLKVAKATNVLFGMLILPSAI